jgi:hypothetical protein
MRPLAIFVAVALAVPSFGAGWYWREYRLLEGPRYTVTQPLDLSAASPNNGRLPAGAVLYHFRDLPEISTYILFVNTKRLDTLKLDQRSTDKSFVVVPVEAF